MLQRYLLVWLILLSTLAFAWPRLVVSGPDPFVLTMRYVDWLIILTMFCVGILLPRRELRTIAQKWPAVAGGVLLQYASMPALAWGCGRLFQLEGDEFLGVVMVGCVPGAMASNVLTFNAKGNVSYSISLTTLATLASPVAVPLAILIALQIRHFDPVLLRTSLFMTATVVVPVAVGYAFAQFFRAPETLRKGANFLANLCILLIIAGVVGKSRNQLAQVEFVLLTALACVNLGGYLAGYLGGRGMGLDEPMRRALTIEIGMQNAGLGVALATHLFPQRPAIAIAPALFTFGCMLTGTALAQWWSRRPPLSDGEGK